MKIKRIHTYIAKVELGKKRFFSSQCAFPQRNSMLVCIETDNGLMGWGEGGQYGPAEPVAACVEHVLAPMLLGRNPLMRDVLWNDMYCATRDFGQKGSYIEAISAIDIALWDLCGKAMNVPITTLLGGRQRNDVATYATGCYYRGEDYLNPKANLENLAAEAQSYVRDGFQMLKIKVGLLSIEEDATRVRAIRRAVGMDVKLFVDCNHAYNAYTAVRMGRVLQDEGILFMEEPVPPEDHEGYRRVRSQLNLAIAGGECEYTRYGFKRFIDDECVDIIQPDLCVCGGFSEFQKIAAQASAAGVAVLPHVWGSGIALAAALSAIAALPNFPHTANPIPLQNEPAVEYDKNMNPLRDELLDTHFQLEHNRLVVPQGVGLGVTVNSDVLNRYTVAHTVCE